MQGMLLFPLTVSARETRVLVVHLRVIAIYARYQVSTPSYSFAASMAPGVPPAHYNPRQTFRSFSELKGSSSDCFTGRQKCAPKERKMGQLHYTGTASNIFHHYQLTTVVRRPPLVTSATLTTGSVPERVPAEAAVD